MAPTRQKLLIFLLSTGLGLIAIREINGDYYWLLAAGRVLSQQGILKEDPFRTLNWSGSWINQQWLFEIILFKTRQLIGDKGILLIYAGCLAGSATIAWSMVRNIKLRIAAYLMTLLSLMSVIDIRTAGIGILLFSTTLYLLNSQWKFRYPAIALLFIPWANLHGSIIAGLILLGLAALGQSLEGKKPIKLWATLGAALCLSLINPAGIDLYRYIIELSSNSALPHLTSEWRAGITRPAVAALTVAFLGLIGLAYRKQRRPVPWEKVLLTLGFAAMTLIASRNAVFLGPLAAYLVANLGEKAKTEWNPSPVALGVMVVAVAGAAILLPTPRVSGDLCSQLIDSLPQKLHNRLYLSSGQGSYLLYRRPAMKSSVDGRLENYSAKELMDNRQMTNGWPHSYRLLGQYQARAVIARTQFARQRLKGWGFKPVLQKGGCTLMVKP